MFYGRWANDLIDETNDAIISYNDGSANDGAKYMGQTQGTIRHGSGTMSWANGDKYIGEFVGDKRQGHGCFVAATGLRCAVPTGLATPVEQAVRLARCALAW